MYSAAFWDFVSATMGLSLAMLSRFGAMTIASMAAAFRQQPTLVA